MIARPSRSIAGTPATVSGTGRQYGGSGAASRGHNCAAVANRGRTSAHNPSERRNDHGERRFRAVTIRKKRIKIGVRCACQGDWYRRRCRVTDDRRFNVD